MIARHIIFKGHVQGVGFRFTAERMAKQHSLNGFVRNLPDGTVEMHAQGESQEVDNCLGAIKDYFGGYIRDINITEIPPDPRYLDFRITF